MRPLAATIIALLLLAPAAWAGQDRLQEAAEADGRHEYLQAVELAMRVARSPKETAERRMQGFRQAADAYLKMACDRLAIATYHQALVELGRYDEHGAEAWWRIAEVHSSREEHGMACAYVESVLAELDVGKLPWPHRFRLLRHRAGCLGRRGQLREAAALDESLAEQARRPEELAEALGSAARCYAELGEFDKAQATLRRLDDGLKSASAVHEASQACQDVVEKLVAAGRRKEALALCGRAFARLGHRDPSSAQAILRRLVSVATDDEAAVMDVVASLEGPAALAVASDEALQRLVPIAARTGRADDLVRVCTHAMLARPLDEQAARTCLGAVVDLRTRQGRHDDALAAARAAYGITGFQSATVAYFARAVGLVAHALRGRDGHLAGGNAFRSYQIHGPAGPDGKPGTADDVANPLAGLKPKPEPALDRLFGTALQAQPPTVDGWRARGWICLLWSKPDKALGAFKRAFAVCPLDAPSMTRAAQDIALGLKALHGTPVGMDAFARFQRYGPKGPDGREGTADDLKDPLAGL